MAACGRFHRISGDSSIDPIEIIQTAILNDNLGAAAGVAVNPVNNIAYLAKIGHTGGTPNVTEWLPTGVQGRTVTFAAAPHELAITRDGSLLYVVNDAGSPNGFVSLVNTQSLMTVGTINVGTSPNGIAISEPNFSWAVNGSGDWATASNWSLLSVPNHVDQDVTFGNAVTSPATINVNVDVAALPHDFQQHEQQLYAAGRWHAFAHAGRQCDD